MGVVQGDHGIGMMIQAAVAASDGGGHSHIVPGVAIGDRVRLARDITDGHDVSMYFERTVSSHGHVVQTRGGIGGHDISILLVRPT